MANIAPMEARSAAYRGMVPWERTSMAITLAQAIRNAIAAEQAAEKFYLSMAGSAGDEDVRRVLVGIAAQEREHATRLEVMGTALVQGDLPERADALVNVIEISPAGAKAVRMDMQQALEFALEAENSAVLYYDALASSCTGEASSFFETVGKQEEAHATAIREILRQGGMD
jgi:rubrerythrin